MPSRHYFDAAATFDIAKRFDFTLVVNKVLDSEPPVVGFGQVQANTDPSL